MALREVSASVHAGTGLKVYGKLQLNLRLSPTDRYPRFGIRRQH